MLASVQPESCGTCHAGAGDEHQAIYDDYIDGANKNLKLVLGTIDPTPVGEGNYTLRLNFRIEDATGNGIADGDKLPSFMSPGQRTFYVVAYDSAHRKFDNLVGFGASPPGDPAACTANCSSGVIDDDNGNYHITLTKVAYDPNTPPAGYTGTLVYGYVAKASAVMINEGHYRLYSDFASDGQVVAGDVESSPYVSTANVEACTKCHGNPYQKHGYREAVVGSLPDFVACKTCHYDTPRRFRPDLAGHAERPVRLGDRWQRLRQQRRRPGSPPAVPVHRGRDERHAHVARHGVPVPAVDGQLQHLPRRQARAGHQ